jgi:hypothetical protein
VDKIKKKNQKKIKKGREEKGDSFKQSALLDIQARKRDTPLAQSSFTWSVPDIPDQSSMNHLPALRGLRSKSNTSFNEKSTTGP